MSVTTDSSLESRHEKPSTWERLSTKQKLLSLVLTIGIPAGMMVGLAQTYGSFREGISTVDGQAVFAGEHIVGSASVGAPQEKVAITVELQRQREESSRAWKLANQAWFVYPDAESIENHDLLPWNGDQEYTAQHKRYETIMALRKLGVDWEIIDNFARNIRIARIDRIAVKEGRKETKRNLSFAVPGRSEIAGVDFGFMTQPHEDAHNLLRISPAGIGEAVAVWFQYFVNGGTPDRPAKFMGCGLAPGDFDYNTAYYDFDALSIWFGLRTGDNLFATMVGIYDRWQHAASENKDGYMSIDEIYKQIEARYKIPQAEIKARFETPESFRCQ